jgi:hypothetical protein
MKNKTTKTETGLVPFLKSPYAKEVKSIQFDWNDVPTGTPFSATIDGTSCKGRIFNDSENGYIYFCQDKMNGSDAPNKLGFKFSWSHDIDYTTVEELREEEITNLKLGVVEKGYKVPEVIKVDGYPVEFHIGQIEIGCTTVTNDVVRKIASLLQD